LLEGGGWDSYLSSLKIFNIYATKKDEKVNKKGKEERAKNIFKIGGAHRHKKIYRLLIGAPCLPCFG
jgi:hypothetical protein